MNYYWIVRVGCFGLVALIAIACACTEAPFEPDPNGSVGYDVYFHTEDNPERWYTYNPETDKLDSITLPTPYSFRTAISPTGDRLYLTRFYGSGLLVINLETRELITELPYDVYYLNVSPDGELLEIEQRDFKLINTTDWSIQYYSDTLLLYDVTFSRDGNYLVGTTSNSTYGWATVADPETVVEEPVTFIGLSMMGKRVLSSPLDDHWYLYNHGRFIDWDRQADTDVFVDTAFNNSIYHCHDVTRDGKYVAYLNQRVSTKTYTELRIYDTELQELVDEVETIIYHESGDTTLFAVDEMVITPDSKWLVGITHQISNYVLVYNLEELRIERFLEIPGDQAFFSPVCQTGE